MTNTIAMTLAQKSDRILAQTRGLSGATPNATQLIEELRWALEAYRQENATLTDENELLRSTVTDCRIEIESTRAERDEARREICMNATAEPYRQMCGSGILLPQDAARERGWDCFKEVR
jgi:regulator of replication initiation timing